jgi:hypothetical protein
LREKWLAHVREYGPHQSKPEVDAFQIPSHVSRHPLRQLGSLVPCLRRLSGLALRVPECGSAEGFKIWEMPGTEYFPREPHSLLGQPLDEMFRDYLPGFRSRRSFVLRIPNGLFHGHDQTLFNKDYELVDWEPPYWAVDCGLPGTMFRGRLPKPRRLRGRVLVLSAPGGTNNIWHLLFDELPKLELARRAGIDWESCDHFLINSRKASFEREALHMLGLRDDKIIETDDVSFVQADELIYVTLGCLIPADPWVLDWVRSKFMQGPAPGASNKKIFLSRKDAKRRRLRNEDLLWKNLRDGGFEKVELANMSLNEQINCIRGCSAIVAPHGAGLTNLVWAGEGTKVVELFSNEYVNACYWLIADMLGLRYAFAVGEATMISPTGGRAIMDMARNASDIVFSNTARVSRLATKFTAA